MGIVGDTQLDPNQLAELFFRPATQLGIFSPLAADGVPPPFRGLLDHHEHMTVTVERFHHCLVDLEVLQVQGTPIDYQRQIVLRRQTDRRIVQYGIVRIGWQFLDPQVRNEIEAQRLPLGRILINHQVLRQVQLSGVWKVRTGPVLEHIFQLGMPETTYGRTAFILCHHQPAIELLEILAPQQNIHDHPSSLDGPPSLAR